MVIVCSHIPAGRDKSGVVFAFITALLLCVPLLFTPLLYANGEKDGRLITEENVAESDFLHGCRLGDLAMVRRCIEAPGFDVNTPQYCGLTFNKTAGLTMAAAKGHLDVVKALIDAGAVVNIRTMEYRPPIYYAVQNEQHEVVDFLIRAQGIQLDMRDDEKPLLVLATENQDVETVRVLASDEAVEAGIDINKTWKGRSALGISIVKNYTEILDILLWTSGIDLNAACYDGTIPVIIAAARADAQLFEALRQAGANPLASSQGTALSLNAEQVAQHARPFSFLGLCRDREKRANCTAIMATCRAIRQGRLPASPVRSASDSMTRLTPVPVLMRETKI